MPLNAIICTKRVFHIVPLTGASRKYDRISSANAPDSTGCTARLAGAEWRCVLRHGINSGSHADVSHTRLALRALRTVAGTHTGFYAGGARY